MPPFPAQYQAVFTTASGGVVAGFDIRTNGYGEDQDENDKVYLIPWSNGLRGLVPSTVVQNRGLRPRTRHYHGLLYLEVDYQLLRSVVNELGALRTPREAAAPCVLVGIDRGNFVDWTNPLAGLSIEIDFVMLI